MKALKPHFILPLAFSAWLTGCASVPDADNILFQAAQTAAPPRITASSGLLSESESAVLLANVGIKNEMQHHLAIEQAVTRTPLFAGNRVRILLDGRETFPAMFAAIQGARNHINLEYFILEDIQNEGVRLSSLLVRKKRQGVSVNIIYDSFGSSDTDNSFFNRLKAAGVSMVKYNPLNPLEARGNGYSPNERDHRKILTVDGSKAIVGGVNLSTTYQEHKLGKSQGPPGTTSDQWRDTDLEIEGPAVARLEDLFLRHWMDQKGPPLNQGKFFPKQQGKGRDIIRIIGSTPEKGIPDYYVTLISAIRHARHSIWLMTAYFVPTLTEKEDLIEAAQRGVDVKILVPDKSDSSMALALQRASYFDLLAGGVKIYESRGVVLHSKVAVIDGVWSAVGSSNLDFRSIVFNDEVDAVVLGAKTGTELQRMYLEDLSKARQVKLKEWQWRPLPDRLHEIYCYLWQAML